MEEDEKLEELRRKMATLEGELVAARASVGYLFQISLSIVGHETRRMMVDKIMEYELQDRGVGDFRGEGFDDFKKKLFDSLDAWVLRHEENASAKEEQ